VAPGGEHAEADDGVENDQRDQHDDPRAWGVGGAQPGIGGALLVSKPVVMSHPTLHGRAGATGTVQA
jgi:hypothetical protein